VDASRLSEAGWGLIIGRGVSPAIRDRLGDLVAHRRADVGNAVNLLRIFENEDAPAPDESASNWLARHRVSMSTVDPVNGVPYYLLIVAPPSQVGFQFQYELDLYWAVGRLWFDDAGDFDVYIRRLVAYERAETRTQKCLAVFAPRHPNDPATEMFNDSLVDALLTHPRGPVGGSLGYSREMHTGEAASKPVLKSLLSGDGRQTPAVLFSGGHGMYFRPGDPRQRRAQGALVCSEWPNDGAIDETQWFAAQDIEAHADLSGMIHFCFACYGAGVPSVDEFAAERGMSRPLADEAFVSRLPQAALAHGALAVIAHVDRALAYRFQTARGMTQSQSFRDVLHALLAGKRVGDALDAFNIQWATLRVELDRLRNRPADPGSSTALLASRLVASIVDARNYVVLGDPAVRTRSADAD
jgi:hypothetical protein